MFLVGPPVIIHHPTGELSLSFQRSLRIGTWMCSSLLTITPGLSWLACWCYFPSAFAAVCDRNGRFSCPKRRRGHWKHVAGTESCRQNAEQVSGCIRCCFPGGNPCTSSLSPLSLCDSSLHVLLWLTQTWLCCADSLLPSASSCRCSRPPFFFFPAPASMLQSADKEHPVQMDSSLSRSRGDCRPEHVISPVAMFASIWYAKKLGRRLVQSSRKAKLLKDEVSLKVLRWAKEAGIPISWQIFFKKKGLKLWEGISMALI